MRKKDNIINKKENLNKVNADSKVSEELQNSHKMLLELKSIQCEFENINSPNKKNDLNLKDQKSNNSDLKINVKLSNCGEDMIKDNIYEDNIETCVTKDKEENIESKIKLSISSDLEMENVKKEVIKALGERVFKAAYDIVYENVNF